VSIGVCFDPRDLGFGVDLDIGEMVGDEQ